MGGDFRQVGGDFLAKALEPEGPPPAQETLVCLFVCYSCGTPESPLPLNPGQGSDSPGTIAATRSISVRGRDKGAVFPTQGGRSRNDTSNPEVA